MKQLGWSRFEKQEVTKGVGDERKRVVTPPPPPLLKKNNFGKTFHQPPTPNL